jgi:hypothetical protein
MTSARPRLAETLMASACAWRVRSAFGLIAEMALIFLSAFGEGGRAGRRAGWG